MNGERFEAIFEATVDRCRETLVNKAREYADDADRMHVFKAAAGLLGGTPEQALWGMQVKHLVSITDMIEKNDFYPAEVWDEKIGDALNYLFLLRAQVSETDDDRTVSKAVDSQLPTIQMSQPGKRRLTPIDHT